MIIVGILGSSGRFVPPITVARTGLGLSAGQFKITDYSATYVYTLTGANTVRATDIVSLNATPAQGTVQPSPPKGGVVGTVVNVARTPYTYYGHFSSTPYCQSHYHDGQCAQGVSHNTWVGPYKNATPPLYTDSEGEWWRIW